MNLDELYNIICDRRDHPVEGSYTRRLLEAGEDEMVKKIGEEAVEVILAAKGQGEQRVVEETADLLYHVLVLLASKDIHPQQVMDELERRHKK
ncbi:MAG: phosphoribosyl-ATP diphosphatase [Anaerolineaceae bacterium]